MLVDHAKKNIFICIPKTGSTTLQYALAEKFNISPTTKSKDPVIYHMNAYDISQIIGTETYSTYKSFAVVRNPYHRILSAYLDFRDQRGIISEKDFHKFILNKFRMHWENNIHFRKQSYFITDKQQKICVSHIYKFEDGIDEIFFNICRENGIESNNTLKKSRENKYDQNNNYFENEEANKVIQEAFLEDFNLLGYDTSPPSF